MQSQHCDLLCEGEEESEEEAKGTSKMLARFYFFFFSIDNKFYWEEIHLKPAMHMPSSALMFKIASVCLWFIHYLISPCEMCAVCLVAQSWTAACQASRSMGFFR